MELKTSRQIGQAFRKIKELITHMDNLKESGFKTTHNLENAIQVLLDELTSKLESFPIAEGYTTTCKTHMVLESGEWYPVHEVTENTQGGIAWSINEIDGSVSNGTSRIGQFALIDDEKEPWINLDIETLRNQEMNFI